jgi:manganese/zinc/iron transport system substrate-binding protein
MLASSLVPAFRFWGLVLGLAATSVGCTQSNSKPGTLNGTFSGGRPLKVFCTTGQVADAVRQLVGDDTEVIGVMGPGVDPHLYQPLPSDILALKQADIVFYNGLHLEGRMAESLESFAGRKPVIAMTDRLVEQKDTRLRQPSEFEGYYDPHVWHDVSLWADCVGYAAERLAEFDPTNASGYRARAKAYREKLELLDDHCRAEIAKIPSERRVLVTTHDAFGYFSAAYGLEAIGLKGISTDDEADFQHIDEVRDLLVTRKIPAVFVESSTPPALMRQLVELCANSGHELHVGLSQEDELYADALGPPDSGADTYEGMMRANVDRIVRGLTAGL